MLSQPEYQKQSRSTSHHHTSQFSSTPTEPTSLKGTTQDVLRSTCAAPYTLFLHTNEYFYLIRAPKRLNQASRSTLHVSCRPTTATTSFFTTRADANTMAMHLAPVASRTWPSLVFLMDMDTDMATIVDGGEALEAIVVAMLVEMEEAVDDVSATCVTMQIVTLRQLRVHIAKAG